MAAVLDDAIRIYRHPGAAKRLPSVHAAEAWIRSDDHSWPFAFVPLCEHLGFDPHAIRATLERERLDRMLAA
ncbi:MAG TPA: hypothetical protein VMS22_06895 [Candidatus Eisenbacteria bacterium]|nr:hypothetical protein [Candidatus Eisenbacteria bacterium]